MRLALYLRYSSHNQDEFSIEGQRKECEAYAKRNNYTIVTEYCDRAKSGTKDDREQFLKMMEDSKHGLFDNILVYKLDRFARNRYDSATYKHELKKKGIRVLSAVEHISDDPAGALTESLLEGMAEYFSLNLGQNVKRGMGQNADNCYYNGGTVPVGLKLETLEILNPASPNKPIIKKKYIIDEEKAPFIQKIFEMYNERTTMANIIKYLNKMGIKTAVNNNFNKSSIRNILTNKKYIGIYSYNGVDTPDGIPRIISDETFEKAQNELVRNGLAPSRNRAKSEYLLTTKLYCGECKDKMTGVSGTSKTGKLHTYYQCVNAKNKKNCDKKSPIKKDLIEDLVVLEAQRFLTYENIGYVADEIARIARDEQDNTQIKYLEKSLKDCEKKKTNAMNSLLEIDNNETVRKLLYDEITKAEKQKLHVEKELLQEKSKHILISSKEVKFFFKKLSKGDIQDEKYKKMLVNTLINSVYLYYNKVILVLNIGNKEKEIEISLIKGLESSSLDKQALPNEF